MIFDSITLHNFGLYRGNQKITLTPPSAEQPIILFGGLNGGGKTTLLDAIQLVLYGKLARCSNRNGMSYGDYLRRCIHSHPDVTEASIMLEFRHTTDGEPTSYRVLRSWRGHTRNISDNVRIWRNGVEDSVLAEQWLEFAEDILPSNIAHLFFFDGEKIESFADPNKSADLLRSAMRSLLGLDLVDRLQADLSALERRKRGAALNSEYKTKLNELNAEIDSLHALNHTANEALAQVNLKIDASQNKLNRIEQMFRREGGTLFEQRQELEAEHARIKGALNQTRKGLIELGGQSDTPLLLVTDLLGKLSEQSHREQRKHDNSLLLQLLSERDAWLTERLRETGVEAERIEQVTSLLEQDRTNRGFSQDAEAFLKLSKEATSLLRRLLPPQSEETRERLRDRLARSRQLQEELTQQDRRLGAVPDRDKIHHLITERERLKSELGALREQRDRHQQELESRSGAIERLSDERSRLLESVARDELKRLDAERLLNYSERSRETLKRFREGVLRSNIDRIEKMILESFQALIRKDDFVRNLKINPDSFELTLLDNQGQHIEANRLSAGERQLLAVSMLWGLARASGRPLPIVIDTPLGRLDSKHRSNLIERYFPRASEQVLLLSTDEEIDAEYYQMLKPYIGRTYHLDFDNEEGRTWIRDGYFWNEELAS